MRAVTTQGRATKCWMGMISLKSPSPAARMPINSQAAFSTEDRNDYRAAPVHRHEYELVAALLHQGTGQNCLANRLGVDCVLGQTKQKSGLAKHQE